MIVMDREAPRFDGYYVRVELTANRRELLVGVAQGGKPAMLSRYAVWNVPIEMVKTSHDLATVVETFANEQRVHNLCDMSSGLAYRFNVQPGEEVYGEGVAPARSRTGTAKQARRVKVRVSEEDGGTSPGLRYDIEA